MMVSITTVFRKNIDSKLNEHIEVFLENDTHADLNEFQRDATGHHKVTL